MSNVNIEDSIEAGLLAGAGDIGRESFEIFNRCILSALEEIAKRPGCECDLYNGYICDLCVVRRLAREALHAAKNGKTEEPMEESE